MKLSGLASGRHLVAGHHGDRAGQGRAAEQRAPPHEGALPHPQEQPAPADGQLHQAVQGVRRGVPQQRSRERKCASHDLCALPQGTHGSSALTLPPPFLFDPSVYGRARKGKSKRCRWQSRVKIIIARVSSLNCTSSPHVILRIARDFLTLDFTMLPNLYASYGCKRAFVTAVKKLAIGAIKPRFVFVMRPRTYTRRLRKLVVCI